ncbi:hypothetical protein KR009_000957, partial [Drosophila setifemur]
IAQAQCRITRQHVEGSNRIFMLRGANNQLSLKRTASSPIGEVLQMWCSRTNIRTTRCRVGRPPNFFPPLPMNCTTAAPMMVVGVVQDRSCRANSYRVGYNVGNQFVELYRSCYEPRRMRAIYVTHRVYAKPFYASRPCLHFTEDGIVRPADTASFSVRSIYSTFRRLFGARQTYIPNNRDTIINRGHLAASADFLFRDQMCATFKYINAVPQFKAINDGNWAQIERWVRNSIRGNQFVNVRTGARGVLNLPSPTGPKDVVLGNNMNPVPQWLYKIVRDATNRPIAAFLTLNNIYMTRRPPAPNFCRPVNCPPNLTLSQAARDGHTFCCDAGTFNP